MLDLVTFPQRRSVRKSLQRMKKILCVLVKFSGNSLFLLFLSRITQSSWTKVYSEPSTAVKTLPDVSSWKLMHTLLRSDPRNALLKHYFIYSSLDNLTPFLKYCSVLNQKKTHLCGLTSGCFTETKTNDTLVILGTFSLLIKVSNHKAWQNFCQVIFLFEALINKYEATKRHL